MGYFLNDVPFPQRCVILNHSWTPLPVEVSRVKGFLPRTRPFQWAYQSLDTASSHACRESLPAPPAAPISSPSIMCLVAIAHMVFFSSDVGCVACKPAAFWWRLSVEVKEKNSAQPSGRILSELFGLFLLEGFTAIGALYGCHWYQLLTVLLFFLGWFVKRTCFWCWFSIAGCSLSCLLSVKEDHANIFSSYNTLVFIFVFHYTARYNVVLPYNVVFLYS